MWQFFLSPARFEFNHHARPFLPETFPASNVNWHAPPKRMLHGQFEGGKSFRLRIRRNSFFFFVIFILATNNGIFNIVNSDGIQYSRFFMMDGLRIALARSKHGEVS